MPNLRRIVWSVFEIVDFSPGFDYVINWFLGAHGTLPERRAKYFDGAKAPTTQTDPLPAHHPFKICGK